MKRNSEPWLRFYVRTLDNPKAQRLPGSTFKGWVNLLCLAKEYDGALPSVEDISFRLRLSKQKVEALLNTLRFNGLVDGDRMHDWDEMQYPSDSSTERVKQHRERARKHHRNVSSNVSVTPQNRIDKNRVETETEQPPKPPARKLADVLPNEFGNWYHSYPRKVGRKDALRAWRKIKPTSELAATMTRAIRNQVAQHHFQNGQGEDFVPNPSTWLNQGRWEDEITGPPKRKMRSAVQEMEEAGLLDD